MPAPLKCTLFTGHPVRRVHFTRSVFFWFYNLFWGAKVTVQMRVLSAPTFFQ